MAFRHSFDVGAVRLTQSVEDVQSEVRNDIAALIGIGGVVLLLGLGLAWVLAGSIARPMRGLAATARRICGADVLARLLCRLQALSATSCASAFCR